MASLFTLRALMALATRIGANPAKAVSRSNITFLGKGPTKNPLFQRPLEGLENATPANLGKPESLWKSIEDAVGWAKDGKLNNIQTEILGRNLTGIEKVLHPPVLPTLPAASVTPIRSGIKTVAPKPRSDIDRLLQEGYTDSRGRRWDFGAQGTGVDASGLKLAKPPKESSKSFLEEMGARGHKVLKPGTPEYEAYMKKGLRTFPGGRLPGTGPGDKSRPFMGWKPKVVPKAVNIPASKINHQIIADQYGIDVELIRGKDWVEVLEVIRNLGLKHGGLARILEV